MTLPFSPTIDGLLADPMIQSAMRADRVDPGALKMMLTRVAASRRAPKLDLEGARFRFGAEPRPTPSQATRLLPAPTWMSDGESCCRC